MLLIDRHILKIFIGYLFGGILVFVTLYLTVNFLVYSNQYKDASTLTLLRFYGFQLPSTIYQLIPVACLMATLFTFSGLHRSNELIALFSSGMSMSRLATPVLILVALVGGLLFFMSDQILPRFAQKTNYVRYVELEKKPGLYSTVKTNRIWYRSENMLFNIKTLNPAAAKAEGIMLYYFDNQWNLVQVIAANTVDMHGHEWNLRDGYVTLFTSDSSFPLTKPFMSKVISMNEDLGDLQTSSNSSDIMTVKALSRFIDHNKEAGLDTIRYEVDYHAKFGFALTALVMALLGVPFSIHKTRSGGAMVNLGVCLGLAFAYWTLYSSCITLGQHGALPPIMAAWTANVLMGGLSLIFLRRLKF